jgi:hypothetical protein
MYAQYYPSVVIRSWIFFEDTIGRSLSPYVVAGNAAPSASAAHARTRLQQTFIFTFGASSRVFNPCEEAPFSSWGARPSHIILRRTSRSLAKCGLIACTTLPNLLLSRPCVIVHGAVSGREGHKKVDRSCQARTGLHLPKRRLAQLGDEGRHCSSARSSQDFRACNPEQPR